MNNAMNILSLMNFLRDGDPNAIYNEMLRTNPGFAQFVDSNKGKPVEQIAKENDIDLTILNYFLN